nr:hypothetical protein [Marinobacter salsuginis]
MAEKMGQRLGQRALL